MASLSDLMSGLYEVLQPLASELVMFALAAVVYVLATRTLLVPVKSGEKIERKRKVWKDTEDTPEVYHEILHFAKSGEVTKSLAALDALGCADKATLPPQVATKVLLAVARGELSTCMRRQFLDLSEHFDLRVFEAAAAEASRWRSVAACGQLLRLAGLVGIHKSEKLLVLLVRGHSNDHKAMHSVVEEILSSGASHGLSEALLAQCNSAKNLKTVRLIQEHEGSTGSDHGRQARLISAFGKDGNLQGALSAFEKIKDSANVVVYNCLLDACIECNALSRALEFFEEMKEKSMADVVSYNTIMKGHLALGDTAAAQKVFMQMNAAGLVASRVTYHALLNAVVNKADLPSAWRIIKEMKSKGIGASSITCSILLKGICGRSRHELVKILELAQECGVQMDEVLFGSFADACIRSGQLKMLWKHFEDLPNIQVSGPSYGSMIKAYGQAQDIQTVKQLWGHMCEKKVKLTAVTLGCMVEALVSNNEVSEAWNIVNETWAKDDQKDLVNTVIYSTIVKGFTMSRQHDKVVAIYQEMKDRGIACNTITYNTMLNALARCGMMQDVPQLLKDMRDSDPPVQPDIITYSTIVKGYCLAGDVDRAFALLDEMKKSRVKPDEVLYNSLLDGCAKQSRVEEAMQLLEEMKEQGVPPSNYTLSILCKLLGRGRRLQQAFNMVTSFTQEYGFKANIQVYTCLMQACIHNRQCQRALALHDQVVQDGGMPDTKTYTVLVRGCLQAGLLDKAAAVVRCAYHLPGHELCETTGHAPGVETGCLEDLLAALGEKREALVQDLQKQGVCCRVGRRRR